MALTSSVDVYHYHFSFSNWNISVTGPVRSRAHMSSSIVANEFYFRTYLLHSVVAVVVFSVVDADVFVCDDEAVLPATVSCHRC